MKFDIISCPIVWYDVGKCYGYITHTATRYKEEQQEAQLNARGGQPYCPQSYKYNHAVRI